jgi:hypothetical protein
LYSGGVSFRIACDCLRLLGADAGAHFGYGLVNDQVYVVQPGKMSKLHSSIRGKQELKSDTRRIKLAAVIPPVLRSYSVYTEMLGPT